MIEDLTALVPVGFFGAVMVLALAECLWPLRAPTAALVPRWTTNIGLYLLSVLVERFVFPLALIAVARRADADMAGLLRVVDLHPAFAVALGVLFIDLWGYALHRASHAIPLLWRLHLVHHADVDVDFTTTERHHPFEAVVGLSVSTLMVYLLGVSPLAIVIYVLLSGPVTLLSHANLSVGNSVDRVLRSVFVTPAVHVVHHSAETRETDSNYGTVFSFWDRAFGSYITPGPSGNGARVLGLAYYREAAWARLDRALLMPFPALPEAHAPRPGDMMERHGGRHHA